VSDGVVVLGGGVAGITAALTLADAGAAVTLLEVRPRLGGAAYSFEREGVWLDNGQHVFLRCCESYRALLRRLGSEHLTHVQERLEIPILRPGHEPTVLRRGRLPAPLHLAGALLRYPHLSLRARAGAARAALALARLDPDDPALNGRTLGAWLAEHGQGSETHAPLWDLIALPTLNLPAAEASLALGAFVFQRGLLEHAAAGDIGFHRAPLSRIIDFPARAALDRAGVELRLGCRAGAVRSVAGGFTAQSDGETLAAAAVIVALPAGRAEEVLPDGALDPRRRPGALAASPIVNVHVFYDRPVCDLPFAAGVDTPVQYLFDRGEPNGIERGRYLAVSVSGARAEMAMRPAEVRERYLPALEALLPAARGARVERVELSREHAATFAAVPGVQSRRPPERTRIPGLALAGAYTATGWPATLESAAISGRRAASAALAHLGADPASGPMRPGPVASRLAPPGSEPSGSVPLGPAPSGLVPLLAATVEGGR
jgi:squalene-associated FAD-dependent desaturase